MNIEQEPNGISQNTDQLIKEAQLNKLQKEIAKIEQETKDLNKNWLVRGLTLETILKVILGIGSVFFVTSAVLVPYYAYREQKLTAAKDSIETAKVIADKLYNTKIAEVNKLSDSVYILRNTIKSLKNSTKAAKGDLASIAKKLDDIKQDSIRKNDRRTLLSNAIDNYKGCLFNSFKVYMEYVRSSDGQRVAAMELGININIKQIRERVDICSDDFRAKIYNISKIKNDVELEKEIRTVESKVEKHFQDVFRNSIGIIDNNTDSNNYSIATENTFYNLQKSIKQRVGIP